MLMKFYSLLFFIAFFSYSCLEKDEPTYERHQFPDTNLKEIILDGNYYFDNPDERREQEKYLRKKGYLKEGEKLEEHYPYIGQERFNYTYSDYCYRKTTDKNPIFKENLRARLYDKEGNLLGEDFLRLAFPERYTADGRYSESFLKEMNFRSDELNRIKAEEALLDSSRAVISYLPYNEKGHEIRIVRLEGEKEVVVKSLEGGEPSKAELERYNLFKRHGRSRRLGEYSYHEDIQCHRSPGSR